MTLGRPSKYEEGFCEKVIELMASGLSLTAAAAEIGISRETAYAWERERPDFSDAVKLARAKRTLKLERDLLAAENQPTVTSRIFALKNACAEEWREKVHQEHTGPDGQPLATGPTIIFQGAPDGQSAPQAMDGPSKQGD